MNFNKIIAFIFFCHIAKLVIIMLLFTHSTQLFIEHCATYNLEVDINNKTPQTILDLFTFFRHQKSSLERFFLYFFLIDFLITYIQRKNIFSLTVFFCILFFKRCKYRHTCKLYPPSRSPLSPTSPLHILHVFFFFTFDHGNKIPALVGKMRM